MEKNDKRDGANGIDRRHFTKVAATTFGLAASGALVPRPLRAAQTLKVAVVLPRSGFLAKAGQDCQRGADIALEFLRRQGYPPIEFINADTETKVARARTAAENAIEAGANILVGAFDSAQTFAVAQVAEQRNIPLVINIAAAPQITEQGYQFISRNFPTARSFVVDAFKLQKQLFAATGTAPESVVLMHVNNTMGNSIARAVTAVHPKFKMPYRIVGSIPIDPRARDLSVEVAKARATGADVLWTTNLLNDAILTTRAMVKQRWTPMGVFSSGPGYFEGQYYKNLGKHSDNVISFAPWFDPKKPMTATFIGLFNKKYPDRQISPQAIYTFEAILVVADAFRRAGSTDPKGLAAAVRTTNIKDNISIGPGIAFDKKGQNTGLGLAAVQNQDGKPHVILPGKVADAKIVFPSPGWRKRG